jgi:hypothetical protein
VVLSAIGSLTLAVTYYDSKGNGKGNAKSIQYPMEEVLAAQKWHILIGR